MIGLFDLPARLDFIFHYSKDDLRLCQRNLQGFCVFDLWKKYSMVTN